MTRKKGAPAVIWRHHVGVYLRALDLPWAAQGQVVERVVWGKSSPAYLVRRKRGATQILVEPDVRPTSWLGIYSRSADQRTPTERHRGHRPRRITYFVCRADPETGDLVTRTKRWSGRLAPRCIRRKRTVTP